MTKSIFIDGAAGTTGLEIAERLAGRDEFTLIALDDGAELSGLQRIVENDANVSEGEAGDDDAAADDSAPAAE
jgi:NAD(P)-dependent dehydrogenase (short-subunit alcohol dehydrogenase family)